LTRGNNANQNPVLKILRRLVRSAQHVLIHVIYPRPAIAWRVFFVWQNGCIFATILGMKTVIDTNVFIGACLGQGACLAVVKACIEEKIAPLMGVALLSEYEDVLSRDDLFVRSRLDAVERDELLDIFLATCRWTRIYYGWRPNLRDEGDNHLVELAIAGGAKYIVTRNLRDVAKMELLFPSLKVVFPETLLKEIKL
jgi:putative PIN family toxin of toxin-antitoxin system